MSRWLQAKRQQRLADEVGCAPKPWRDQLRVALVYPNHYYHAMSNLGFQAVYQLIQNREDCLCERFFYPDSDELSEYRSTAQPLLSLESGRSLDAFDIIAFSVSFENDYVHIPTIFELARIPLWAEQREGKWPLVIAGGLCAFLNPEPIAEFMDLLVVGEAEVLLEPLLDRVQQLGQSAPQRRQLLADLATQPGYYVPSLYAVDYAADATIAAIRPLGKARLPVERCWAADLNQTRCQSLIHTPHTAFGMMDLVEVSRGCGRGCRFCATGFAYLPPREKSAATVLAQLQPQLGEGKTAGLVGAAVSDYSELACVSAAVVSAGGNVSVASLRIDTMTRAQVQALKQSGQKTIALAPEAGSQRLRNLVNKHLSREQIIGAVQCLAGEGILNLKLYFLIGLPTENEQDLEEMMDLITEIRQVWVEMQRPFGRLGTITLSVNPFIPKPMTPFQWVAMATVPELKKSVSFLRKQINRLPNVQLQVESLRSAELQGVLARGDRRLAQILPALARGDNLKTACRSHGMDPHFYSQRQRRREEILPWDVLASGVSRDYLWEDYQQGMRSALVRGCYDECRRCGVCFPADRKVK